jgi:hypothetical protein
MNHLHTRRRGNFLLDYDIELAYNILWGNAEVQYEELDKYPFVTSLSYVDPEKEAMKKIALERLPPEAKEFIAFIVFGSDEELESFKNKSYCTFNKPKVREFFKNKGCSTNKIKFIFKKMREYTKLL